MTKQNVLVVDDEISVLKAIAKSVMLAGHHVEQASNAYDALALCERGSFDVLVLDLMMPGIDGLELLANIRRIQPTVKAIIVSGKLSQDSAEEEIAKRLKQQIEADFYLHKPITAKRLLDAIQSVYVEPTVSQWKEIAAEMVSESRISIEAAHDASESLRPLKRGE